MLRKLRQKNGFLIKKNVHYLLTHLNFLAQFFILLSPLKKADQKLQTNTYSAATYFLYTSYLLIILSTGYIV